MRSSSPNLIFSFLPLFFFLLLTTTFATKNLIKTICKESSKNDQNIDYTFCLNALQSIPSSKGANLAHLGLISINLVKNNVTSTSSLINHLLIRNNNNRRIKQALKDCLELYTDSSTMVSEAERDYRAKRFGDANVKISSVMDSSTTCEQGFQDVEVVSPLKKQNNCTFQLGAIALSFINMLH